MTPLEALLELLERVGASRGAAALVSEEELSRWPAEAVRELKAQKLLAKSESGCQRGMPRLRAGMRYAGAYTTCRDGASGIVCCLRQAG